MAKSMKSVIKSVKSNKSVAVNTGPVAEDQWFDWPISIPEGVLRKRVPAMKFPIDMRLIRAKEKAKREAQEKSNAGKGKGREYVVAIKGGQPHLAPPPQASRMTIAVVASIFAALLLASIGLFTFFMIQAGQDE